MLTSPVATPLAASAAEPSSVPASDAANRRGRLGMGDLRKFS
jgi:hypothetical protein